VTKVFTTNLLGQAVYKGRLSLNDPLSAFGTQLGAFKLLTRQVTLKQLADFTSGFPDLAPSCNTPKPPPGCLPSSRPTPGAYDAQTFLKFFQNTVPKNYQATPPKKVSSLPAPYFYSDFSLGLLGLILGGNPRVSLSNEVLGGWVKLLENRLLLPLGMRNTYLYPLPNNQGRLALGYDQAVATAVIAAGQVQEIKLEVPGSGYESPPKVSIKGGGGTGAEATAQVDSKGAVKGFAVTQGGHGYLLPLLITFTPPSGGNGSNSSPKAAVIVSNKMVVGIKIIDRGSGYETAPAVVISGGRRSGIGRDAKGTAHIANGAVTFVSIDDGGDGYEQPVAVTIEPGGAFTSPVPIWAPAGALHSTIRDMTNFAAVALGRAPHLSRSGDYGRVQDRRNALCL
jgi:CubicO group peptidase (beta-lactamase class C family)